MNRQGWVYFIREQRTGDPTQDLIKIGWSGNVTKRKESLQQYADFPLAVLVCFPGTEADEKRLHAKFSTSRVEGEWFRPCPEILEAVATGTLPSFPQGEFVPKGEKQKRLAIHWGPGWDNALVFEAKKIAIGRGISFSAFVAEAVRRELEREAAPDKPKKK